MTTTTLPMTEEHVEALLALLVSLDSRLRAPDAATAEIRVRAWAALLAEVDPAYAVRHAELAYQEVRDWPLAPAEILQAWRERQRTEAETVGERLFHGPEYAAPAGGWTSNPVMMDWLHAVAEAHKRGEGPESVPMPVNSRPAMSAAQDAWERRCVFHRLCACDHTGCRDGWLDEETTTPGPLSAAYLKVTRCPHCADAAAMAEERGIAKSPSVRATRRRS